MPEMYRTVNNFINLCQKYSKTGLSGVSSWYSCFLLQSKNIDCRLIGVSEWYISLSGAYVSLSSPWTACYPDSRVRQKQKHESWLCRIRSPWHRLALSLNERLFCRRLLTPWIREETQSRRSLEFVFCASVLFNKQLDGNFSTVSAFCLLNLPWRFI